MIKKIFRKFLFWGMDNFKFIDKYTTIGEYTYIGEYSFITKATIGRYCSIGNEVIVGPGEHILDEISTSSVFYEDDVYETLTRSDVIIGNDVWIGARAIILRGVTIGNGAVIGAGSIVTKDVPPFAIVVGSPARIIRYRFTETERKIIEDSEWWFHNKEVASKIIKKIKHT